MGKFSKTKYVFQITIYFGIHLHGDKCHRVQDYVYIKKYKLTIYLAIYSEYYQNICL